jgi:hypothetical protein
VHFIFGKVGKQDVSDMSISLWGLVKILKNYKFSAHSSTLHVWKDRKTGCFRYEHFITGTGKNTEK